MKIVFKIVSGLLFTGLVSCGNAGQPAASGGNDTIAGSADGAVAITETIVTTVDSDAYVNELADAARTVFGMVLMPCEQPDGAEQLAASKCTPEFIAVLHELNDYDDSIAWYALRTMSQDGPEKSSEIISITPDGPEAVVVSYSDMGHKASTRLMFVRQDDGWKINSAVVTENGETRAIN